MGHQCKDNDPCRLLLKNSLDKIKILKIEGEGAEPDILQGAASILDRLEYICVDCGPERGLAKDSTLPDFKGFQVQKVNNKRLTALFVQST